MTLFAYEILVIKVPINTLAQSRLLIKNSFGGLISRVAGCTSWVVPTGQTGKVASVTASCVRVVKVLFGACALSKILVRNQKLGDVAVFAGWVCSVLDVYVTSWAWTKAESFKAVGTVGTVFALGLVLCLGLKETAKHGVTLWDWFGGKDVVRSFRSGHCEVNNQCGFYPVFGTSQADECHVPVL